MCKTDRMMGIEMVKFWLKQLGNIDNFLARLKTVPVGDCVAAVSQFFDYVEEEMCVTVRSVWGEK